MEKSELSQSHVVTVAVPQAPVGLGSVAMPPEAEGSRIESMAVFAGGLFVALAARRDTPATILRMDLESRAWTPARTQIAAGNWRRSGAALPADFPDAGPDAGTAGGPGCDAAHTGMAVFCGPGLYVTTACEAGARLLRADAEGKVTVIWQGPERGALGLRAPVVWGDFLVTAGFAPAGAGDDGLSGRVLASRDPGREDWTALSAPGFGDPENDAVTALSVQNGRLYAATANRKIGFQLWSLGAVGEAWVQHLKEGAARFAMNPRVACMASRGSELWIGTAMPVPPAVRASEWPAAEVIVLHDDGDWELIAGEPRFTPQGLRVPLSLYGPGFDDPDATTIGAIAVQGNEIVIGTGPAAWLWTSADAEDWTETDLGAEDAAVVAAGGVTAMAAADGQLWIAAGGRLYLRGTAGNG
jgi:hypothetical protein